MFKEKWREVAGHVNQLNEKLNENKENECGNKVKITKLNSDIGKINKEFQNFSQICDEKFNQRLNSLATTYGIKCLSCGEKDLNYPPLNKYTYGDDNKIYLFENNDVSVINKINNFSETQTRPNSHFRIQSGKQSQKTSSHNVTTGESEFSKKHIVLEHNAKRHQPLKKSNYVQKNFMKKARPQTSIPLQKILFS